MFMNCYHLKSILFVNTLWRSYSVKHETFLQKNVIKTMDWQKLFLFKTNIKETYERRQTSRHMYEKYMRNNANFYDMRCIRLSMTSKLIFFNIGKTMVYLNDQKDV